MNTEMQKVIDELKDRARYQILSEADLTIKAFEESNKKMNEIIERLEILEKNEKKEQPV